MRTSSRLAVGGPLAGAVAACLLVACTRGVNASSPPEGAAGPPASANAELDGGPAREAIDPVLATLVRAAFSEHRAWGRVDDELRWAPFKCLAPMPARPLRSEAAGGGHARKLYSLFARDRQAYAALERTDGGAEAPPGAGPQAIVKESYAAVRVEAEAGAPPAAERLRALEGRPTLGDHFDAYLREGEALYRADSLAAVFVMVDVRGDGRLPPEASDAGWIYGTLTPEGEVTSAGRVMSCMDCHARAPHGRLFGPKIDHRPYGLAR